MLWCLSVNAVDPSTLPDFKKDVLPVLKNRCVRCHGPDTQESGIRLDTLSTDLLNDRAATETWHEVLNVLNAGEMPPSDEAQLSKQELQKVTLWVRSAVEQALEARRQTDGRVVLRRLNRTEYQNTMTDLLRLEMDYARDLPPDAVSADGFTNDGNSLSMSPIQLEYYLATARRALDRVIVSGAAPEVFRYTFEESNLDKWLGKAVRSNRLQRQQEFLATMPEDYPEEGDFLVRVKLAAELKPETGFPLLEVSVGYRPDTQILLNAFDVVEITSPDEQTFEFRGRLENFPLPVRGQGKFPGLVVRVRNIYDDGTPRPPEQKDENKKRTYAGEPGLPVLNIQSVEFHGPVFEQWPPLSHRQILFDSDLRGADEPAYVAAVLKKFMVRAWRRPVSDVEVAKMVNFFKAIRPEFPSFEETIRETLAMVLISPDFLYLMEPGGEIKRPIGEWELANRLSYFLWSTMPDEELTELAASGRLQRPKVLAKQVDRMIEDPRSLRFVRQFTEQWLQLNFIDSIAVDSKRYPGVDDSLKQDMVAETQRMFEELLRHNMSGLSLLSSEFTMLNEPLAGHYGIKGVFGRAFRRVKLQADQHRGGLLGQASVLMINSTGADSHPVRRAVWIRDRLLNDPPAPPPPDVPTLDDSKDPAFLKLPVREQLVIHRDKEACAGCHRNIDPWGIALENFDAAGLWREEYRSGDKTRPVVAEDTLPDGRQLNGADQLKQYLLTEQKDRFAASLVSRLLTYALGRRLELNDQATVDSITADFAANDFRLRDLVQKVVASSLFQTK